MIEIDKIDSVLLDEAPALPDYNFDLLEDRHKKDLEHAESPVTFSLACTDVGSERGFVFPMRQRDQLLDVSVADGPRVREYIQRKKLYCKLDRDIEKLCDSTVDQQGWVGFGDALDTTSFQSIMDSVVQILTHECRATMTYLKLYLPGRKRVTHGAVYMAEPKKNLESILWRIDYNPNTWMPGSLSEPIIVTEPRQQDRKRYGKASEADKVRYRKYQEIFKQLNVKSEFCYPLHVTINGRHKPVGLVNMHYAEGYNEKQLRERYEQAYQLFSGLGEVIERCMNRMLTQINLERLDRQAYEDARAIRALAEDAWQGKGTAAYEQVSFDRIVTDLNLERHRKNGKALKKLTVQCEPRTTLQAVDQLYRAAEAESEERARLVVGGWKARWEEMLGPALYVAPPSTNGFKQHHSYESSPFFRGWSTNGNQERDTRRAVADAIAFCHAGHTGRIARQDSGAIPGRAIPGVDWISLT